MERRGSLSSGGPPRSVNAALQGDLRQLSNEPNTSPSLKAAIERALLKLIFAGKSKTTTLLQLLTVSPEILLPFFMACETAVPNLVHTGLDGIHRVVSNQGLAPEWLPKLTSTLSMITTQFDENTQIKALRCSVELLSTYSFPVHGDDIKLCLLIPLRLFTSKDVNIQSVAAAALRQSIDAVFERMKIEATGDASSPSIHHNRANSNRSPPVLSTSIDPISPLNTEARLYLIDVQCIFKDLLKAAESEPVPWLGTDLLLRDFSLIMMEELILGHTHAFSFEELSALISNQLPSLLDRLIRRHKEFSVVIRVLRLIVALSRTHPTILLEKAEVLLKRLVVLLEGSHPLWLKTVVVEALYRLLTHHTFVLQLYQHFDAKGIDKMFESIILKVGRFVKNQLQTESSVFLPHPTKDVKVACLEMISLVDPPDVRSGYLVTVSLQCLTSLADTIAILIESPKSGAGLICSEEELGLADASWPPVLAALSHVLTESLDESLIQLILKAFQSFTQSCGQLGVDVARDAFLTAMKKNAIPLDPGPPKEAGRLPDMFSLITPTANKHTKYSLKNIQTVKRLVNVAFTSGNTLGDAWVIVLDALEPLHTLFFTATYMDDAVGDELSRDELYALHEALGALFSTTSSYSDDQLLSLLHILETRARQKLFPTVAPEQESLDQQPKSYILSKVSFELSKFIDSILSNLQRISVLWNSIHDFITVVCVHGNEHVRDQGLRALAKIVETAMHSEESESMELPLLSEIKTLASSSFEDVRDAALTQVHAILQHYGHQLREGWPFVLTILRTTVENSGKFESKPKQVSTAFGSLQFICTDFLNSLSYSNISQLVKTIASYGAVISPVNIAITAVGGLLWNVSDFLASSATKEMLGVLDHQILWRELYHQLIHLSVSPRNEIRTAALRALFGVLTTHGTTMEDNEWQTLLDSLFSLLENIAQFASEQSNDAPLKEHQLGTQNGQSVMMMVHHSRNTAAKQWNETRVIALEGVLRVFKNFFPTLQCVLPDITTYWKLILSHIDSYWDNSSIEIALAGVRAVETMLIASREVESYPEELWRQGWKSYLKMSSTLSQKEILISHTAINTFNASIKILNEKFFSVFSPQEILKPLPLLNVEYAGELSMLHSTVMEIFTKWRHIIPRIVSISLRYISVAIGYFYEPNCERFCVSSEDTSLFGSDSIFAAPKTAHQEHWDAASCVVSNKHISLAEKSLNLLTTVWKYLYSNEVVFDESGANSLSNNSELVLVLFEDIARVTGRAMQLCRVESTLRLSSLSFNLFETVIATSTTFYLESMSHADTLLSANLLWTDIVDSLEALIHAPPFIPPARNPTGSTSPPNSPTINRTNTLPATLFSMPIRSGGPSGATVRLLRITRALVYHCGRLPIIQSRLISILVDCTNPDSSIPSDVTRLSYLHLVRLLSTEKSLSEEDPLQLDLSEEFWNLPSPLIGQLVASIVAPKVLVRIEDFLKQIYTADVNNSLTREQESEALYIFDLLLQSEFHSNIGLKVSGSCTFIYELMPSLVSLVCIENLPIREAVKQLFTKIMNDLYDSKSTKDSRDGS